jgi:hypothetical protein
MGGPLAQMMQIVISSTGKPEMSGVFSPEDNQEKEWIRWNQKGNKEIKP